MQMSEVREICSQNTHELNSRIAARGISVVKASSRLRSASQVGTFEVTISATPLPGALPLFATGIGGLGLLGWRRKPGALPLFATGIGGLGLLGWRRKRKAQG
jgi:hypothetical protein